MKPLLNSIKKVIKKIFPGISWQNPIVNFIFRLIDPLDYLVRILTGRRHMPPYSVRVRSNGVTEQFGGKKFQAHGRLIQEILSSSAGLNNKSRVLEIGCGCGRTAVSLAEFIQSGSYTGIDIERISLEACKNLPILNRKGFSFQVLDVYNSEYNPSGKYKAHEYQFPFAENSFDVIFLISVFTHMLTKDVSQYIKESARLLNNGGSILFSTFLMDKGTTGQRISFPYAKDEYYYNNLDLPEIAVGYLLAFFEKEARSCGLVMMNSPIWGTWREETQSVASKFPQDIIILHKP